MRLFPRHSPVLSDFSATGNRILPGGTGARRVRDGWRLTAAGQAERRGCSVLEPEYSYGERPVRRNSCNAGRCPVRRFRRTRTIWAARWGLSSAEALGHILPPR